MKTTNTLKFLVFSLSLLSVALTGCGQKTQEQSSETKITGGVTVPRSQFPAVVALNLTSELGSFACTGTFVSHYQVITAAHCAEGIKSAQANLYNGKKLKALSWSYNKNYPSLQNADLAVINFTPRSAPATVAIGSQPAAGNAFTIVGFGNTTISPYYYVKLDQEGNLLAKLWEHTGSDGRLREGINTIDEVTDGLISFVGEMTNTNRNKGNAGASTGDSGGPMLVNGKLVGVTSFGKPDLGEPELFREDDEGAIFRLPVKEVKTSYIDLNSESSQEFLNLNNL